MFSDDKRGGTAPTPTRRTRASSPTTSRLDLELTTVASDLVDLNLAFGPVPPQEGVVLRPAHISRLLMNGRPSSPSTRGAGSPSKAFDEPRDLRRKPSGTRKKTPKSAPKYRTEQRTSPDRTTSVKPQLCHSSFICRPWQQGPLEHTSEKVDISEARLLRTSKKRCAGDARVA